jgi:hypothetical protein
MDDNFNINELDKELLSADLNAVAVICLLFVAFMVITIQVLPFQAFQSEAQASLELEEMVEESGETIKLSSIKPTPAISHKPSLKHSKTKKEFRISKSRFDFPPFKGKKGENAYHSIIHNASKKHDIEPALVKAVIMAESSYNPRAVSPKGAVGLMQLMPKTAESLGVANSFNPEQNVHAGTRYLKKLIDQFDGDIKLALAAYNAGLTQVKKHKGIPPFKDTIYYVHKVYHYYDFYRKQEAVDRGQNIKKNTNKNKGSEENIDEA